MLGHLGSQPRPRGCPGWSWGEQVSCRCCDSTAHPVLLILGSFLGFLGEFFTCFLKPKEFLVSAGLGQLL